MNDLNQLLFVISLGMGAIIIIMGSIVFISEMMKAYGGSPSKGLVIVATGAFLSLTAPMLRTPSEEPTSPEGTPAPTPDPQPEKIPAPTPDPQPSEEVLDPAIVLNVMGWALLLIAVILALVAATALVRWMWKRAAARKRAEKTRLVERERAWARVRADYEEQVLTIGSYELDWDLAFSYPAFNDVCVPQTAAMIKALAHAQDLERTTDRDAPIGGSEELLTDFRTAVRELAEKVRLAQSHARRVGLEGLDPRDRKDLTQAKKILEQARDEANPEAFRRNLYRRLKTIVDELNSRHAEPILPQPLAEQIETTLLPQLEGGARP